MPKKVSGHTITLLEEYRRAHELWRYLGRITWVMGTIFIPVSFAVLGYAATIGKNFMPLALASITVLTVWIFSAMRLDTIAGVLYKRMFMIEEELNMHLIRSVDQVRFRSLSAHVLRWFLFLSLVIAWIVLWYTSLPV